MLRYEFDVTGPVVRWLQDSPKHKRLLLERGTLRVKNHPGVRVNPSGQFGAEAYLVPFTESPEGYRKRKKREAKQHKVS